VRVARGTSATTFSPNAPVSRAQFATLLVHTLATTGIGVEIGPDAFDDDAGNLHEMMIDALAHNGIAAGVGPRRFDPNGQVRRDAMASFVMRGVDFGLELGGIRSAFEEHHRLAAMTPGQVSNGTGGEPDASGTGGIWTIGQPDVVCFTMYGREIGSGRDNVEAGAYLARGARGTDGEILVDLPPPTPANNHPFSAAQTSSAGCVKVHPDTVSEVVQRPEGLYLGLATFEYAEALRGQLGAIDRELTANLTGAEVVPGPGDPDGVGRAVLTTTTQPDQLCWSLDVARVGTVTAARIHTGASGANGPAVVTLAPGPGADGVVAWCTAGVDPAVVTAMEAAPRNHHVQLATTERPSGALRGQLR
jgi:hypothetical protein